MTAISVPIVPSENGVARYLREIWRFPVLTAEEEYMLALRWREHGDVDAAHKLVTSHLRLVAKIAMKYRGYGLPVADLLSEGNIGLMKAVKKFEPERGFRLATYAIWWIKAAMTEYVLRSWSLVRMGTMAAQKKMFFNLRRLKSRLEILDNGDISVDDARALAERLNVSEEEIVDMNRRISSRDASLNTPLGEEEGMEFQDTLVDDSPSPEAIAIRGDEASRRRRLLVDALKTLNERERHIFVERRLKEDPVTLEELGQHYGISRERVRQLEARAFEKIQDLVRVNAGADASALAA
ncbi:RNA polymerase sigma factor RpoH [Shumkonia mesophila]|uniref:RNA polymerase sigma factor RpoH n=1 Tax=Shumkonia mesophila TaxID=2838854 RepID=UPI0029347F14|nr:RNA polymerase sigma factor RpoH [Shumkonia mesophila]